jgi:serine/threonine protein phosphatase PrpC
MKPIIFGRNVQGASHKRTETECQDSYKKIEMDGDAVVLSVADGHGSKTCLYSKTGSNIAVNVFCKEMENLYGGYHDNLEALLTFLKRDGDTKIAQQIHAEWKRRVLAIHKKYKRDIPKLENGEINEREIYKLYGTTLLGLMITPLFVFAFQIGDGDITCVDNAGVKQFLISDKILGTETHSLSKIDAWENAITVLYRRESFIQENLLFMLSTDGFSNSYRNEEEFKKTCTDYFEMIKQYGVKEVCNNLKDWLDETSEQGCGDDITLLMAYFADDSNSELMQFDGDKLEPEDASSYDLSDETEDGIDEGTKGSCCSIG